MPNWDEAVAEGDASVALLYAATSADGAEWTGSAGYVRVIEVNGGGPASDTWQAGANRARNGWTVGAAAALTNYGQDAGRESALGIGILHDIT